MEWYAARTRSNHEAVAAGILLNRFPDVFLPTYSSARWERKIRVVSERPLFPGYVFVRCDSTYEEWLEVKKAHGVVDLVGYQPGLPESIPLEQIQSIRLLMESGQALPHVFLRAGDMARVTSGVFKGLTGKYLRESDTKGVLVLSIDLLGQAVSVEIDPYSVEPC